LVTFKIVKNRRREIDRAVRTISPIHFFKENDNEEKKMCRTFVIAPGFTALFPHTGLQNNQGHKGEIFFYEVPQHTA